MGWLTNRYNKKTSKKYGWLPSWFGFDLKIAKVTGVLVFVGSFVLTVLFHLLGRNFL